MLKNNIIIVCYITATIFLLGACSSHPTGYQGMQYEPTDKVVAVYQAGQIPKSCRVTSHVLVNLPPKFSGKNSAEAIGDEAKMRGSDIVLVGQARQSEDGDELTFTYFGPAREYNIQRWAGWNFGYDKWEDQGEWVNIGYTEWGNSSVEFDYPVMIQLAFVRCQ